MKKIIFISIILILPVFGWSQKETKFQSTLENKGYTEVEWTYIRQMKTAANALDNCSKSKTRCDLTDPVKNKKASAKEQVSLGWSWGASQSVTIQKNMARFEKQLLKSKKFPGYSYSAMSSRMGFYNMSMESVDDDE